MDQMAVVEVGGRMMADELVSYMTTCIHFLLRMLSYLILSYLLSLPVIASISSRS